ncbi:hypothetical protein, partial [Novipirellula sp.]|uniref:hypothetical protein n=1 Tax=Novipirellula sp. TaxID=2795430 RepID=UPI003569B6BD
MTVRPHFHSRALGVSAKCRKSNIGGIAACADANKSPDWGKSGRVKQKPFSTEVGFKESVKVWRLLFD